MAILRRRLPLRLAAVLGLHASLGLGCMLFPWEDPIIYQALDYRIDRPRLLALAVNPPVLRSGYPVVLEALALAPGGQQATDGVWKTCGLGQDGWTSIWGLECFSEDVDVHELAQGTPVSWTPPALSIECDTGEYGYYGYYWSDCGHYLPFLYEAELGGQTVRGTFQAYLGVDEVDAEDMPASMRDVPLTLTAGEVANGEVRLEAWMGSPQSYASFRWYVDDGTLLDTGRTAVQGQRDGGCWTANRWVLPTEPGSYRAVVVIGGNDMWGRPAKPVDSGRLDTAWWDDLWPETADMTWAILTVEVE